MVSDADISASRVEIVLSTYNGERFLPELLESCLAQTFTGWQMLVRDDGSTDKTVDILHRYVEAHPGKFIFIHDQLGNLGPGMSFGVLLGRTAAPYVMFCDQDDVWVKTKIEMFLQKMQELGGCSPSGLPLMVCSDASLVDADLRVRARSMRDHLGFNIPRQLQFRSLALKNIIPGCTVMINRRLVEMAVPFPQGVFMHDWWTGVIAAGLGKLGYIPFPTVLYRQHGNNALGMENIVLSPDIAVLRKVCQDFLKSHRYAEEQMAAFYQKFPLEAAPSKHNMPSWRDLKDVSGFLSLKRMGFFRRKWFLLKFFLACPWSWRNGVSILIL